MRDCKKIFAKQGGRERASGRGGVLAKRKKGDKQEEKEVGKLNHEQGRIFETTALS